MEINIYQVLFQIFNFGVILWVLTKYLYKPVLKMLDDRAKKINEGQAAAEKNIKAAAELEKEHKEMLSKARKEASAITRDATTEAKKQADAIIYEARQKAAAESAQLHKAAEDEIAKKHKEMESSLKQLVVATTSKLLSEVLTEAEIAKINKNITAKLG